MTLKQWREFRTVIIRALLMIVRHLQKEEQTEKEKFGDFNHETFDMVLFEARKLAEKEILPTAPNG